MSGRIRLLSQWGEYVNDDVDKKCLLGHEACSKTIPWSKRARDVSVWERPPPCCFLTWHVHVSTDALSTDCLPGHVTHEEPCLTPVTSIVHPVALSANPLFHAHCQRAQVAFFVQIVHETTMWYVDILRGVVAMAWQWRVLLSDWKHSDSIESRNFGDVFECKVLRQSSYFYCGQISENFRLSSYGNFCALAIKRDVMNTTNRHIFPCQCILHFYSKSTKKHLF